MNYRKVNPAYVALAMIIILFLVSWAKADVPSDQLITALIQVESGGNDSPTPGDQKFKKWAYGPLQIRQDVCTDYNDEHGTSIKAQDCQGNRALSIKLCRWYLDHYTNELRLGHKPTAEDFARIWNGGPVGCFDNGFLTRGGKTWLNRQDLKKPMSDADRQKHHDNLVQQQKNAKAYWVKVSKNLN